MATSNLFGGRERGSWLTLEGLVDVLVSLVGLPVGLVGVPVSLVDPIASEVSLPLGPLVTYQLARLANIPANQAYQ